MVSHHPARFGGRRHCGSGVMFLMVEVLDFTCSSLNLPSLFIFKEHGLKAHDMTSPILVTRV